MTSDLEARCAEVLRAAIVDGAVFDMNRAGRIMAAFGSALMCRHGEGTFERGQYEALIDAALRAAEEAGR